MNEIIRKVKYKDEIDLAGFKLPCYVLNDGTRVLSSRGMQDALKMTDEDDKQSSGGKLVQNLSQKSLQPFINVEKTSVHFEPIICYDGDKKINGYEATVLSDICNIYLEARRNIHLSPRQKIIADQCEILMRSFAKVGIIALIDEATGYQYEREKAELQAILKVFISEEILKWQETFQIDFYKQIFRLWNIPFTARSIKKKPQFIGYLTNQLIYKNLPKGSFVLSKLKEKTPRTKGGHPRYKLHQSLKETGREALKKVIYTVEALASISKDKNQFLRLVKEKYHPEKDLPYIDIEAMDDNKKETKVDKVLGALLKTPKPKKDK